MSETKKGANEGVVYDDTGAFQPATLILIPGRSTVMFKRKAKICKIVALYIYGKIQV